MAGTPDGCKRNSTATARGNLGSYFVDMRLLALRVCFMAKRNILFLLGILCLLAALVFLGMKAMRSGTSEKADRQDLSGGTPPLTRIQDPDQPPQTRRERPDDAGAKALRDLEAEFDKILPARFPNKFSSLCDTTLKPDETLVVGGFKKSNGNHEFTLVQVVPVAADGSPFESEGNAPSYKTKIWIVGLSGEESYKIGLDSLFSPAKTQIQKNRVFPPGETPWLNAQDVSSGPYLTTKPDQAAFIQLGEDDKAFAISLIVSSTNTANSFRIRTRVESPAGY